jgi:phosphate transport system permease protein
MNAHYQKRKAADRRYRYYGMAAVGFALLLLLALLSSIISRGWSGLQEAKLYLTIPTAPLAAIAEDDEALYRYDYRNLLHEAVLESFPEVETRAQKRALITLISIGAPYQLRDVVLAKAPHLPEALQVALSASDPVNLYLKGSLAPDVLAEKLSATQLEFIRQMKDKEMLQLGVDYRFFTVGDSREPEMAGFLASMVGSILTIMVCLALAFPLGVMTAIYLQEYAQKGWFSDLIEVNINNLAAVPSIVFGLLGLALYLNFFGLPRSSALVGGLTLALMTLPVIIISTRAALRAVPPSIRDGARALGATELQVVLHHTFPLALPGIMTGTILGVARALGETAPLLMIGMVAFIADVPGAVTDPATAMPVQIYLWASSPEVSFMEKTAAGILVLLAVLLLLNLLAIYLRNKFERKW